MERIDEDNDDDEDAHEDDLIGEWAFIQVKGRPWMKPRLRPPYVILSFSLSLSIYIYIYIYFKAHETYHSSVRLARWVFYRISSYSDRRNDRLYHEDTNCLVESHGQTIDT